MNGEHQTYGILPRVQKHDQIFGSGVTIFDLALVAVGVHGQLAGLEPLVGLVDAGLRGNLLRGLRLLRPGRHGLRLSTDI